MSVLCDFLLDADFLEHRVPIGEDVWLMQERDEIALPLTPQMIQFQLYPDA